MFFFIGMKIKFYDDFLNCGEVNRNLNFPEYRKIFVNEFKDV